MRFLKEGLAALALNLALATPVWGQDSNLATKTNEVNSVVVSVDNYNFEQNYKNVRDYLVRFSKEFVDDISKESKSVRKNLKKYGDKFRDDYFFIHLSCLDLAKKSLDGKISEEDCLNTTIEICKRQKRYSSSVDYSDKDVIKSEKEWVKERVGFLTRLLKARGSFKTGEEIIRAAYSRKEYGDYVNRQSDKATNLYDKIGGSLSYLASIFGGKGEVGCVSDNACDFYSESIDRIYGK